jgi:hypothetical protein
MKGGKGLIAAARAPEFWLLLVVTIAACAGVGVARRRPALV